MNAFDAFCLPSHFEGLGIVLIEAQVNGLTCVASSKVPAEANIAGTVKYLALGIGYEAWADSLISCESNERNRLVDMGSIVNAGYSIANEAIKLQEIYLRMLADLT